MRRIQTEKATCKGCGTEKLYASKLFKRRRNYPYGVKSKKISTFVCKYCGGMQ